jgi:hypothetical protein
MPGNCAGVLKRSLSNVYSICIYVTVFTHRLLRLPASCDTSSLLPNAMDLGDCSTELLSGSSCTNTGSPGYTCNPSFCRNGMFEIKGKCKGNLPERACCTHLSSCIMVIRMEFSYMDIGYG